MEKQNDEKNRRPHQKGGAIHPQFAENTRWGVVGVWGGFGGGGGGGWGKKGERGENFSLQKQGAIAA